VDQKHINEFLAKIGKAIPTKKQIEDDPYLDKMKNKLMMKSP